MEFGAVYTFTSPDQFWSELDDILSLQPTSCSLEELDYALRNYISFVAYYMDEYLPTPSHLSQSLLHLLSSSIFTSHQDRLTAQTISLISDPTSTNSILLISLMLVLLLGGQNPFLTTDEQDSHQNQHHPPLTYQGGGGGKVFKAMRKKWAEVVPVLMEKVVEDEGVRETVPGEEGEKPEKRKVGSWEERVGTVAAAVLYEVCRVQRLNKGELSLFTLPFITHLFHLIELSRDSEDETFNYTLIKLLIALNEQFMVVSLPPSTSSSTAGVASLPPPILPKVLHGDKGEEGVEEGDNLVLVVLKKMGDHTKTFGENVIFILNRSNGTPDSLCVALLILKLLYLLFTTSGTHEYFYTNDLCVLVDVFIRELNDLGDESEGLKHTYLRVLHPLLTNTQLRYHPYKRPALRHVLHSLVSTGSYRDIDPTTKRLVERNLRGSWCDGLGENGTSGNAGERRGSGGWSSGMGGRRDENGGTGSGGKKRDKRVDEMVEARGSTLSVHEVASTPSHSHHHHSKHHHKSPPANLSISSSLSLDPPLSTSPTSSLPPTTLSPPTATTRPRSSSLLAPLLHSPSFTNLKITPSEPAPRAVSVGNVTRRKAPPPPTGAGGSRSGTPVPPESPRGGERSLTPVGGREEKRRAAPEPPRKVSGG